MNHNCKKYFILSGIVMLVSVSAIKLISELTGKNEIAKGLTHVFVNWNPILICFSISLFWIFYMMNLKSNRFINKAAKCVFGIYILHENQVLSGENSLLWCQFFRLNESFYTIQFPIVLIADALVVFCGAFILTLLYKTIANIILNNLRINEKVNEFMKNYNY